MRTKLPACVTFPLCLLLVTTQAPSLAGQDTAPVPTSSLPAPHTLLDGTPVKLRLSQTISSADARVGQEIPFEAIEEVKVDDVVVIPKGATAIANVTEAEHKRSMGRAGKLNISITYIRLADNEKAAMRAVKESKGGGHVGAMTGAIVATSIVFFPAAPLFLFIHGKDITIPQGTEITAFTEGDMHLDMSRFGVSPAGSVAPMPAAAASGQTAISIDSSPTGADIEVDGAFVGNTPSSVSVASGPHELTITKKGFTTWNRKITTTSGSIHISAELEAGAAAPAGNAAPDATTAPTASSSPQ
jgi:hypothetical protein